MEEIQKPEQSPEESLKGKIRLLRLRYDLPSMISEFGISEQKILYAARQLPIGLKRTDVFNNDTFLPTFSLSHCLCALKKAPHLFTLKATKKLHQEIIASGGANSHLECLFIRYVRNTMFKRRHLQ